jgi:dihydroorotate dehydrogenase (NAD+) catalytic subunit
MDLDVSTSLSGIKLKSPIVVAGGVMSEELLLRTLETNVGAVTVGSYALTPKSYHPRPFMIKVPYGYVNAYGIRKSIKDAEDFVLKIVDNAERNDVKVICSFIEEEINDICYGVKQLQNLGCSIIELNLSAPIIPGLLVKGLNVELVKEIINKVKGSINIPLSLKLSPLIQDIATVGKELASSGADILHLINALSPAVAIDLRSGAPILRTRMGLGALTGPAIKPIALAKVLILSNSVEVPIIGTGGITSWEDAVEMIMVGASAIGIHSALYLKGIKVINEITDGIKSYMSKYGYSSIKELRGLTLRYIK